MDLEQPNTNNRKARIAGVSVAVVALIVFSIILLSPRKSSDQAATVSTPASVPASSAATTGHRYKDGTYTATGTYDSPGGHESIKVNVTLKGDTVTDSSAQAESNNRTSQQYETQFIDQYKPSVIGMSLDSLDASTVSGPSLTVAGFDDALQQIKAKAQA